MQLAVFDLSKKAVGVEREGARIEAPRGEGWGGGVSLSTGGGVWEFLRLMVIHISKRQFHQSRIPSGSQS